MISWLKEAYEAISLTHIMIKKIMSQMLTNESLLALLVAMEVLIAIEVVVDGPVGMEVGR